PEQLIEPCILAGSPEGGIILDPFFGAGTVGLVSINKGRKFIGIDINHKYCEIAAKRIFN
ncbi:MAG: DNA methyltransferase, partial [Dolichospermum sp.]